MTEEAQLVRWYLARPHTLAGDGTWTMAIGTLLKRAAGGTVSAKMQAYVAGALAALRAERARELQS